MKIKFIQFYKSDKILYLKFKSNYLILRHALFKYIK